VTTDTSANIPVTCLNIPKRIIASLYKKAKRPLAPDPLHFSSCVTLNFCSVFATRPIGNHIAQFCLLQVDGMVLRLRRTIHPNVSALNTAVVWLFACEPRVTFCPPHSQPHPAEPSPAVPSSGDVISNTCDEHFICTTFGEGREPQREQQWK
jgi:hypothetical protein